ncbi:MAG: MiaB/RimO family radical SAM methylthiotransferase [Candidatus Omnitrophica bacterium]|nr:MiaB/RimO family radical SAM methylthiotransferase [Candidatus Omnitrophota bacterium]
MKTIKFYTLGCKVNQYDTQSIRENFLKKGFSEIRGEKKADFYLINTCSVTQSADKKSRYLIKRCAKENKNARIIVTGCLAEKDSKDLSGIKGINYIISKRFFPDGINNFCGRTRAFLKIQDGCDNFCSYCKVPLVRGGSRSRPLKEIVYEAEKLVENGFREIVLTGICLGSYGKGLAPRRNLVDVINALEKIEGLWRLRLSSIEANQVTGELIQKIAASKKLCRHLHIPMQSGDDEILKEMNRKYSRKDYLELVNKIKRAVPQIAITTDIMVGFPGEKEENFQNTARLIKEILPLKTHIFPYSPRQGTRAAGFSNQVAPEIMKLRLCALNNLAEKCSRDFKNKFIKKEFKVLIESKSKEDTGCWEGYTDNYIKVLTASGKNLANRLIRVKIKEIYKDYMLTYRTYNI